MFTFAQRFFVFINLFISGMWRIIWYCTVWDRVFTRYPCSDIYRCLFATGHRPANIGMSPKTVHVVAALPVLCTPLQTVMQVIPRCHGGVCASRNLCLLYTTQCETRESSTRTPHSHGTNSPPFHRYTVPPIIAIQNPHQFVVVQAASHPMFHPQNSECNRRRRLPRIFHVIMWTVENLFSYTHYTTLATGRTMHRWKKKTVEEKWSGLPSTDANVDVPPMHMATYAHTATQHIQMLHAQKHPVLYNVQYYMCNIG